MDAAELAQAHWNASPLYLSEQERYADYPWLYQAAEFAEHRGDRVLEIGCGTGCDLLQFAKNGAVAVGVDITERHLELARQRIGNLATVYKADIRHLPYADSSFDYVYSHGVLHHCDEPTKAVREILRVLRPGGRFNIHVYALFSESMAVYLLKHGWNWRRYVENSTDDVHIALYTARKLRRLFYPVPLTVHKYHCYHLKFTAPLLGWYLVAKGVKP